MSAKKADIAGLPDWPRLLSPVQSAAYVGLSLGTFNTRCPIEPIALGSRRLYDRKALDAWVDALGGHGAEYGAGLGGVSWEKSA